MLATLPFIVDTSDELARHRVIGEHREARLFEAVSELASRTVLLEVNNGHAECRIIFKSCSAGG